MSEEKLDLILQRLGGIDARLDRIELRLDRLESDLSEIKGDVKETNKLLADTREDMRDIGGVVKGAGLPNLNLRIGAAMMGSAGMVAFFLMLADRYLR